MNSYEELAEGRYGSFDLKKEIGPNMLWGLLFSFLAHAMIVSAPFIVNLFQNDEVLKEQIGRKVFLLPPLQMQKPPDHVRISQPELALPPDAVIPIAAPDDPIIENPVLSQAQLKISLGATDEPYEGGWDEVPIIEEDPDVIPKPYQYIAIEFEPLALNNNPLPAYPRNIGDAGIQGRVVARAYVDKNGNIRDYIIIAVKPEGLGFEDEVKKVIMKWKFTPAFQNHKPIGVWVDIPFVFKVE